VFQFPGILRRDYSVIVLPETLDGKLTAFPRRALFKRVCVRLIGPDSASGSKVPTGPKKKGGPDFSASAFVPAWLLLRGFRRRGCRCRRRAAGAAPAGAADFCSSTPRSMNFNVSSMSWMRSFERFTAPSYSGLPLALSMNDWKICCDWRRSAFCFSLSSEPFALNSCVRMPSL